MVKPRAASAAGWWRFRGLGGACVTLLCQPSLFTKTNHNLIPTNHIKRGTGCMLDWKVYCLILDSPTHLTMLHKTV